MEKINFQDATLTANAKVTIDGVDHEVTPATYEGGTDLNAKTLNYAFQLMHPVGSIYMTTVETNPANVFGFGTWELWGAGKVPVGIDISDSDFNTVEKTGGEKTHTLTSSEIPSNFPRPRLKDKTQSQTDNKSAINTEYTKNWGLGGVDNSIQTGGGKAHNNLQPYITCYMFKRTA